MCIQKHKYNCNFALCDKTYTNKFTFVKGTMKTLKVLMKHNGKDIALIKIIELHQNMHQSFLPLIILNGLFHYVLRNYLYMIKVKSSVSLNINSF